MSPSSAKARFLTSMLGLVAFLGWLVFYKSSVTSHLTVQAPLALTVTLDDEPLRQDPPAKMLDSLHQLYPGKSWEELKALILARPDGKTYSFYYSIPLETGEHVLSASDDKGHAASKRFTVNWNALPTFRAQVVQTGDGLKILGLR